MFVFEKEQYIYNIGNTRIGGTRGENPTVLAGTIFYSEHKIVENPKTGVFNQEKAEELINAQDEMSEATGIPSLVHIFSESERAIRKYIDFVAGITDAPIIIDSTNASVRIIGLEHAEEVGVQDRCIYNSINLSITDEELQRLKDIQHECAIVLAFNPQDPSISGKRAVLENGIGELDKGLLSLSEELGVTKPLIDTAVTAMGAGAGSAAAFTFVSKILYGHPVGSGIHNGPSSWSWLKKFKKKNRMAYKSCDVASSLIVQVLGADYILYGPISSAPEVFPIVAMGEVFAAEAAKQEFGLEPVDGHPFTKLL
ncbi:tetrahydromethanopterin S-methyltransferase subunit H [Candidatus Thorarchaeota archaeon]|nr:MAG: tetrahydromethanopterin S-methyltransferase subunit H [Candidatus Thorarchaeota archaeon]